MRWKLLIIVVPLAALSGALPVLLGFYFGLLDATPTTLREAFTKPNIRFLLTLLLPVAALIYATIFVYRHTARRRLLQALLTFLFATTLLLAALHFGLMLLNKVLRPQSPSTTRSA